ncbi:MAG: SAM-dependent methyltransferase [Marmoricola sp.]
MADLAKLAQLLADSESLVRAIATGRRKGHQVDHRRVELRYVDLKSGRHLQVTSYDETQAHTSNHDDPGAVIARLVEVPFANWHVETLTHVHQIKVTKRGEVHWHERAQPGSVDRGHDQGKQRLLDPGEPIFAALGLSNADGQIKPSKQAKYRQVEDFLRLLMPAVEGAHKAGLLPVDQPLRVVDLGCGNAYLTFSAAVLLAKQGPVEVIGVDVKEQSRVHNSKVATDLGLDRVRFEVGEIAEVALPWRPHVVLALHACDTATDECIARAVEWEAPLILAAPCCHKDLSRQLRATKAPARYRALVRDGILRERFADTLTDAVRASLLRARGYRVDVVEFVDSAHTPRNTLIRATLTGAVQADDSAALIAELGLEPKLGQLLADVRQP